MRVDWNGCYLNDTNENHTVNWHFKQLMDGNGSVTLDWGDKKLYGNWFILSGGLTVDGNYGIYIGNAFLNESRLSALAALVDQAPSMLSSI